MLEANFIIIYIIHKISVLLKLTRILKHFLKSKIHRFFFTRCNKRSKFDKDKNMEKKNTVNDK